MFEKIKKSLLCGTVITGVGLAACSALAAPAGETVTRSEATRPVAFDVIMPLRNRGSLEAFVADLNDRASPNFHKWLTPAQFGLRFGPNSESVKLVADSLRSRGFQVTEQTRSLHATGTSDQVERNFGTHLLVGRSAAGATHLMQESALRLPPEIAATGAQVFSFSPHVAHTNAVVVGKVDPDNRRGATGSYWWTDLKQLYAYPSVQDTVSVNGQTLPLDGTGVTLGVLMEGDILDKDIKAMFNHEKYTAISGKPIPQVARVRVNGGGGLNTGGIFEASLDTQEETTGAPGAQVVLYNLPDLSNGNTEAGYLMIVEQNAVDLVSSSFGECELFFGPAYNGGQSNYDLLASVHEIFLQGNAQGITFLASSGDGAGKECPNLNYLTGGGPARFRASISSPADDTAVTAVGGTNVISGSSLNSLTSPYVAETAWSDPEIPHDPYGVGTDATGGVWGAGSGYSDYFKKPAYQSMVTTGSTTKRAVPDIGMQVGGCPSGVSILDPVDNRCDGNGNKKDGYPDYRRSSVVVSVDGTFYSLIGTSVSSPELAGALALLIETQGRQGNINAYLYGLAAAQASGSGPYFHTNIPGYNGVENTNLNSAYSLSVGVGTPIVASMVGQATATLSGIPQTPSNP